MEHVYNNSLRSNYVIVGNFRVSVCAEVDIGVLNSRFEEYIVDFFASEIASQPVVVIGVCAAFCMTYENLLRATYIWGLVFSASYLRIPIFSEGQGLVLVELFPVLGILIRLSGGEMCFKVKTEQERFCKHDSGYCGLRYVYRIVVEALYISFEVFRCKSKALDYVFICEV